MSRKYHITTLGCQMNKNDSERISGLLSTVGLKMTDKAEEADVLLINTCSVRQSAEDRVFGVVKNWQELRERKPELVICITGCLPGRDKDGKLRKKFPGVDLFFPIDELNLLPKRLLSLNLDLFSNNFDDPGDYLRVDPLRSNNISASITIQTGCDNFCSYCAVPYARGRERNRPVADILAEIRQAVASGIKEVVLLGQVVNNYHASDFWIPAPRSQSGTSFAGMTRQKAGITETSYDFAALLWEVNQIDGLERIHWTAADPQYFNDEQIEALKLPKQINYLHLPVQSGDNEILRKMNRKYTREYYIDLIKKIRVARPNIAIGTDLIVGFCGETDEQFNNTLDLYRQCDFDIAYQAKYSERAGTAAAKAFKDDVPRAIKKQRWQAVQDLMEETTHRKNQKYSGQTVSVLVDKRKKNICFGNSSEMKLVQFPGASDLIGQIVSVKIDWVDTWVLRGKVV
ncbi:MAG: tRNA (N6-isopentenyl adenosine(37)-C2)-methylthiotransferase MiaB [Candidatus Magasanikbacteria bacterium]|nr:tRNA (N6-isopentenyl adenosine(37)-C2)-methylthiotransferase MiaB [Candidatus Magasanikbacteria bacterium]